MRQVDRPRETLPRHPDRWQLVEWDDDVGAQRLLREHGRLRRELQRGAVQVRAKLNASLRDRQQRAHVAPARRAPPLELGRILGALVPEREDLEAARVGDDRPTLAAHEHVQPACRLHDIWPRMHHQVVRVGKL
jgi:hypothetical protein